MSHLGKVNGVETEWTIAQRKLGNLPELEKEKEEIIVEKSTEQILNEKYGNKTVDELDEYEDDLDESILLKFKQQRLNELKNTIKMNKFGGVTEIGKQNWVDEVTKCKDHWVVIHLYTNSSMECDLLDKILKELAPKHKSTKFLRIKGNHAIKNFPDSRCPCILIYHNGEMKKQWIGFGDGSADSVEWELSQVGAVKTDLTEKPRKKIKKPKFIYNRKTYDSDSDTDSD